MQTHVLVRMAAATTFSWAWKGRALKSKWFWRQLSPSIVLLAKESSEALPLLIRLQGWGHVTSFSLNYPQKPHSNTGLQHGQLGTGPWQHHYIHFPPLTGHLCRHWTPPGREMMGVSISPPAAPDLTDVGEAASMPRTSTGRKHVKKGQPRSNSHFRRRESGMTSQEQPSWKQSSCRVHGCSAQHISGYVMNISAEMQCIRLCCRRSTQRRARAVGWPGAP